MATSGWDCTMTLIAGSGPWKRKVITAMEIMNSGCGGQETLITAEVIRTVCNWETMAYGMLCPAKVIKSLSATVVRKTHHEKHYNDIHRMWPLLLGDSCISCVPHV